VIFSARLVSGYTIPRTLYDERAYLPMRDLLVLSLLLHRNNTTEGQFSLYQ